MYVLTSEQMQSIDEYTMKELGFTQEVLMEKAALCSVNEILKENPKRVLCVCGNGNNGGDGIAVARILFMQGISAAVYLCYDPKYCKESVQKQLSVFLKVGGKIVTKNDFMQYAIIVDAVFGIGLNRAVSGPFDEVISLINETKEKNSTKVISLDIPSGINSNSGRVMGRAVKADKTVAFSYAKRGHLIYPGKEYCGKLVVSDAGMYLNHSNLDKKEVAFSFFDRKEAVLPKLSKTAHKGNAGRILIIAGCKEMAGACYLSACAAFRLGSGLVDIYTAKENLEALKTMLPEAILHNSSNDVDFMVLNSLLDQSDCVVLGPGISTDDNANECVSFVLNNCKKTLIIDADGINCIARNPVLLYNHVKRTNAPVVLTPHPKELSRLISVSVSDILENYSEILFQKASEFGIILVGKGASSFVTDGKAFYINQSGNEGMATAGSGDVLSGMIAAIAVRSENIFDAVCKGVYFHGLCGDFCADKLGKTSVMAHDLLDGIIYLNKTE